MDNILQKRLYEDVLIFDGGIGTEIYKNNFFINTCFEELSLSAPKIISQIHEEYYDSGADVLTLNTFGANRNKLSKFGFGSKVKEINSAAVKLARESSSDETLLAGSVGPIGKIAYNSGLTDNDIIDMLVEQISALKDAKADFIMFETLPSLKDSEFAIKAINQIKGIPYVLSFAVSREGESSKGDSLKKLMNSFVNYEFKPTAIGLNCGVGPEGLLSALELLIPICSYPIIAQPNVGAPRNIDNRTFYMTSPEYFTTYAVRYLNIGVRGIGGCCGTSPEHINDMSNSIRPLTKNAFSKQAKIVVSEDIIQEPIPTEKKSKLGAKLAKGEWIETVEIVPPRGHLLGSTIKKAIQCREAGIDAINIPDGPRASSRMSPIIASHFIQVKAQIETVLHFCCRDRNLIGMQSDLLGCAAADLKNMLFVTGDPPKLGDYPYASAVFDADSIGMVTIQSNLNKGIDLGGNALSKQTAALIGVGADPNAIDFEREIRRTKEKVEAGAEFIITQPVFDIESLFVFLDMISDFHIPVIAGIWPLASYRNAEFMQNEVPGVVVPDTVMDRMAKAKTKEEQRQEGINIARESIAAIRDRIQGVQVSAPFGNVNTAIEVLKD